MPIKLTTYRQYQVFLNYPYDDDFKHLANAIQFAVVASNYLPVCAKDISTPDRPRLDILIDIITNCHYSIHDFSRFKGEGEENFARFNMPLETGMALFYALNTQRRDHRCIFFVSTPHDYQKFISDLSGLDPKCHNKDELIIVGQVYEWLREVTHPSSVFNLRPTVEIQDKYLHFKKQNQKIKGSNNNRPSYFETKEVMYQICGECGWWDWRETKVGKEEFPKVPISWINSKET